MTGKNKYKTLLLVDVNANTTVVVLYIAKKKPTYSPKSWVFPLKTPAGNVVNRLRVKYLGKNNHNKEK